MKIDFNTTFMKLTDFEPFPWQQRLFDQFVNGQFDDCASCSLPTGLGKTSLLVLWLIALANNSSNVPRRLVYVVNRRTVVDQTTYEAKRLLDRLDSVPQLKSALAKLCSIRESPDGSEICPLAISTLRGQYADNRKWSADPCRPAIISGTVDMIGSRLLFDGYRCGFKSKPMHAGFLGTDVLLIHDEAHLEPAFQQLLTRIQREQYNGRFPESDSGRRLRLIELSATTRGQEPSEASPPFELDDSDRQNAEIQRRINAKKGIAFHNVEKEGDIADEIARLAKTHDECGKAILVFVRKVEDVKKVVVQLEKGRDKKLPKNIVQLTGTIRGYERDRLATKDAVFQRFLPKNSRNTDVEPTEGTVYLVATSAGEVGVNISADHLVCDLSTFESVVQRFGRVNRFGTGDALIDMVVPQSIIGPDESELKPYDLAMQRTRRLLGNLPGREDGRFDASPAALSDLDADERSRAFSPLPEILHVDEILFDAWSMTTFSMPAISK